MVAFFWRRHVDWSILFDFACPIGAVTLVEIKLKIVRSQTRQTNVALYFIIYYFLIIISSNFFFQKNFCCFFTFASTCNGTKERNRNTGHFHRC